MLATGFMDTKCAILVALTFTLFCTVVASEETIFHGKPAVSASKAGLVTRKAASMDKCAKVCLDEKTFKCHFFKFVESSKTCYLSERNHEHVDNLIANTNQSTTTNTSPGIIEIEQKKDGRSSISEIKDSKIKQLKKELKQLQKTAKKLKNVDKDVSNLRKTTKAKKANILKIKKQNNREEKAMLNLQSQIKSLTEKIEQLKTGMSNVQKEQKSFSEFTKSLKDSDTSAKKDVKKLLSLVNDAKNNAAQLSSFNRTVEQNFKLISTHTKSVDGRIDRLLKEIKEGKYLKDMKSVKTDEVKMAKLLDKVSSRDQHFKSKIDKLQNDLVKMEKSLKKTGSENEAVISSISKMNEVLQNLKKNIKEDADPMSKTNRMWQRNVNDIKNFISRLTESNGRLTKEMKSNDKKLANIMKDWRGTQLGMKNITSQVDNVESNYAQMKKTVINLVKEEAKLPTIIQMTKMSSTVLKSLSALENKNKNVAEKVEGFRGALKGLTKKVSNNEKLAETYKEIVQKRQKQHQNLSDTFKHYKKNLLILAKRIVPKKNIMAVDNKEQKVEGSLAETRNAVKSLKHELKTAKASLSAEIDRQLTSMLRNVLGKFSKTVESLQSEVKTEYEEMSKLRKKVTTLQHGDKILAKEMEKNTAAISKATEDKNLKTTTKEKSNHQSNSKNKSHSKEKKPKKKNISKNRDTRSPTDTGIIESGPKQPYGIEGNILSKTEHSNSAGRRHCPQGYDLHGLNCYKLITSQLVYDDAKRMCENYNGKIIVIDSQAKQTDIAHFAKLNKSEGLWISAMIYDSRKQQFLWDASNTEVLYNNYSSPYYNKDDPKAKRCNIFNMNMNGAWIGFPCGEKEHSGVRLPTVCEIAGTNSHAN